MRGLKVNLGIGVSSDVASEYIDQLKRVKTLELLKEKLSLEMPPEKKVSKYRPYVTDWKDGDIFGLVMKYLI